MGETLTAAVVGTCLCRSIKFEVSGPYLWAAHCYCSMCRKHHGALFSTSLGVHVERFRWLEGEDRVVHYRSSPAFERPFCSVCGSKVPGRSQAPHVMNVPAGTLEDQSVVEPRTHIFVAAKSPCCAITDSLPQYDAYPPGMDLPEMTQPPTFETPGRVTGGCLCAAVAYEVDGDLERLIDCACPRCRRSRGGLGSTDAHIPAARFRWTHGVELVKSFELQADAEDFRTDFCGRCGSLLPTVATARREVTIPAGSVDTPLRQSLKRSRSNPPR